MSKFEVSQFCRAAAFEILDWGDWTLYPWTVTLPPPFSATATIIDINGTAYERLWRGLVRHVKYCGKSRPCCWVMDRDSWAPHWKQTQVDKFTDKIVDLGYLFTQWANRDVLSSWNDGSWHINRHYVKGVLPVGNISGWSAPRLIPLCYCTFK